MLSRNVPYYSDVTGSDMGLIIVVNNTSDDYFYNVFNNIGFSASFPSCSHNLQTLFTSFRFKSTTTTSSLINPADQQLNDSSALVRKCLSESTPTASPRRKIFWATQLKSGSVCSPMRTRRTRSTHEASASSTVEFAVSKLCVIAFRSIFLLLTYTAIHRKYARCSTCLASTNTKVNQNLMFSMIPLIVALIAVKWSTIMSDLISIVGLEREMEESLLCRECYPSCSNNRYRLTTSSLPLVVNRRAGFGIT